MIIAIDFDGTITEDVPRPFIAPIRDEARQYIKKLYKDGHTLVLWTAREGADYFDCLRRLKKARLYNYFTFTYDRCGYTGKLIADVYIDDRACAEPLNWSKYYEYITRLNN